LFRRLEQRRPRGSEGERHPGSLRQVEISSETSRRAPSHCAASLTRTFKVGSSREKVASERLFGSHTNLGVDDRVPDRGKV